jgi:hypothetical protein
MGVTGKFIHYNEQGQGLVHSFYSCSDTSRILLRHTRLLRKWRKEMLVAEVRVRESFLMSGAGIRLH